MEETAEQAAARVRRNRELVAERTGWPDGALVACLAIEEEYPLWTVYWDLGLKERPPGFRAVVNIRNVAYQCYGKTADELVEQLKVRDLELPVDGLRPIPSLLEKPAVPGQRCYGVAGFEDDGCEFRWPHGEHAIGVRPDRP